MNRFNKGERVEYIGPLREFQSLTGVATGLWRDGYGQCQVIWGTNMQPTWHNANCVRLLNKVIFMVWNGKHE